MISAPTCSPRFRPCIVDGDSRQFRTRLRRIELESLGGTPFLYTCNTVLNNRDCISDAWDGWMIRELRVVQFVVDVMLFDHSRKVLSINHKSEWPEDRTLISVLEKRSWSWYWFEKNVLTTSLTICISYENLHIFGSSRHFIILCEDLRCSPIYYNTESIVRYEDNEICTPAQYLIQFEHHSSYGTRDYK